MSRSTAAVLALVTAAVWPAAVQAQSPEVIQRCKKARAELAQGRTKEALGSAIWCAKMAGSGPLRKDALLVAYGTNRELGNAIAAGQALALWLRSNHATKERVDAARAKIEAIDEKLLETHGKVILTSAPDGASVKVDGQPAGVDFEITPPIDLYLLPGTHRIEVYAPDHGLWWRELIAHAGVTQTMHAILSPTVPETPPPDTTEPTRTPEPEPRPSETSGLWIAGWTSLGIGLALAAGGATSYGYAVSNLDRFDTLGEEPDFDEDDLKAWRRLEDETRRLEVVGWTLLGSAAAALITGTTLLILDGGQEPDTAVGVVYMDGGAAVVFGGNL